MSATKQAWTPGPWRITHQTASDYSWDIVVDSHILATTGCTRDENSEVAANAKLIAKAPEMAAELERMLISYHGMHDISTQQPDHRKCELNTCKRIAGLLREAGAL